MSASVGTKRNTYGIWSRQLFADSSVVDGPVRLIFIAGIAAEDPEDGHILHLGGLAAQSDMAFEKQDPILASLLVRLHVALERPGDRLVFDQLFAQVGEALMERYIVSAPSVSEANSTNNSISRVLEFVEANCHRNLSLADLAQVSPYCPSHFLRRFKESVGLTPHAYLTQMRVEWASAQLRSGKAIADVASTLGFTDQSHLMRQFRRMFGLTPGQYAASLS